MDATISYFYVLFAVCIFFTYLGTFCTYFDIFLLHIWARFCTYFYQGLQQGGTKDRARPKVQRSKIGARQATKGRDGKERRGEATGLST